MLVELKLVAFISSLTVEEMIPCESCISFSVIEVQIIIDNTEMSKLSHCTLNSH